MTTYNRSRIPRPVVRLCDLCSQPKSIYPESVEHRKAHQTREIAFVCQECAAAVRTQVEAAGENAEHPKATA